MANFKQTVIEKRRKYNQALTLLMSDDKARTGSAGGAPNEKETGQQDPFLNSILNSSLVQNKSRRFKVMSLTGTNQRMGELTAANTQFTLRENPRVNQI